MAATIKWWGGGQGHVDFPITEAPDPVPFRPILIIFPVFRLPVDSLSAPVPPVTPFSSIRRSITHSFVPCPLARGFFP